MEQNSSNPKIVSLHLQKCSGYCPNASVCYHKNKFEGSSTVLPIMNTMRVALLEKGYKIHESICEINNDYYFNLMENYSNYNITISCMELNKGNRKELYAEDYKDQIQVSVYTEEDVLDYKYYQKLFLIKGWESLGVAYNLMKKDTGKLHFLLDQKFLVFGKEPKKRIVNFIEEFQDRKVSHQTADTCLTSWLVNGHCPNEKDYLDITFDKTARKCPYAKKGIDMCNLEESSIEEYMSINLDYHYICDPTFKCIYSEIFKGEKNEQSLINKDIQNRSTNNGSRSNSKRVRRLSLRR